METLWFLAYMQQQQITECFFKSDDEKDCISCLTLCCSNNKNSLEQVVVIKNIETTKLDKNAINVLKNSMKKGEKQK